MRILEVYELRNHGKVAIVKLDCNGPLPGDLLCRSDGREWPIKGVEWWAMQRFPAEDGNGTSRPGAGHSVGLLVGFDACIEVGDFVQFARKVRSSQ